MPGTLPPGPAPLGWGARHTVRSSRSRPRPDSHPSPIFPPPQATYHAPRLLANVPTGQDRSLHRFPTAWRLSPPYHPSTPPPGSRRNRAALETAAPSDVSGGFPTPSTQPGRSLNGEPTGPHLGPTTPLSPPQTPESPSFTLVNHPGGNSLRGQRGPAGPPRYLPVGGCTPHAAPLLAGRPSGLPPSLVEDGSPHTSTGSVLHP